MGKFLVILTVLSALVVGGGIYYTQVYAYYDELPANAPAARMQMVSVATGERQPILVEGVEAIDSDSSPLRFRACFTTPMSLAMLTETYAPMDRAVPLVAPKWFDCFDAVEIGTAIETGDALAFLGQHEIHDGVDRVIAIFPDGRGYAWHQLNEKYED